MNNSEEATDVATAAGTSVLWSMSIVLFWKRNAIWHYIYKQ